MKHYPMYYGGVKQVYSNVPPGSAIYAKSIVEGNLVFLSGMDGRDVGTGVVTSNIFKEQMVIALDKIREAMEEVGSSMNNILKVHMVVANPEDYTCMRRTELEYYQKHAPLLVENPPASTVITASLPEPEFLIEIDAVGVISRDKPGSEVKFYPEYLSGQKLAYPHMAPEAPKYSRSAVAGNLIFLSSVTGQNMETGVIASNVFFEKQMVIALDKIRVAMEEAGSSMDNIVRTLMIIKNLKDYPRMRKTEVEYYQKYAPLLVEDPPDSTFIVPTFMPTSGSSVEIDVTGVISRDKPGSELKFYPCYWGGKKLAYPYVNPEHPKFAASAVVGNLIFVSGCEALNHQTVRTETDNFEEQVVICLDKIRTVLEEAGSSMNNIIKTHMLLIHPENYFSLRKVEFEYYRKHAPLLLEQPPASTCIVPASLAMPEFLVEIEVYAVASREK